MFKKLLSAVQRITKHRPLTKEERLERLQQKLVLHIRKGRDEDDANAVALALRADAILQQPKPFDERCQQVHDVLIDHLAQKLVTRLHSYSH